MLRPLGLAVTTTIVAISALAACLANGVGENADELTIAADAGDANAPKDARADTIATPQDASLVPSAEDAGDAASNDAMRGDDATADASTASCAPAEGCLSAADLGSVSGDTSSPPQRATGFTSKWLMVKVSEDNASVLGQKLRVSATLESPAGENFDLYAYVDTGGGTATRACGGSSAQSTNGLGQTDAISLSWGEGALANSSDDGRIVSFEVRAASSACAPDATWTLTISGD